MRTSSNAFTGSQSSANCVIFKDNKKQTMQGI